MRISRSEPRRKCPICRRLEALVGDHCHETGEDRDAICRRCNAGLGMFGDDPKAMRRAARYVELWRNTFKSDDLLAYVRGERDAFTPVR